MPRRRDRGGDSQPSGSKAAGNAEGAVRRRSVLARGAYVAYLIALNSGAEITPVGRASDLLDREFVAVGIHRTAQNTKLRYAGLIGPSAVEASTQHVVVIDRDLPAESIARFAEAEDGRRLIRYNAQYPLTPDEFEFVLHHEMRHGMQTEAGVRETDSERALPWAMRPWEIDAIGYAEAVTGIKYREVHAAVLLRSKAGRAAL